MLVVISNPTSVENEFQTITQLFEAGLEYFHLYKPAFNSDEMEAFVSNIPEVYHQKLALHREQLKFHSLKEIEAYSKSFQYAFLSPIFDSISKNRYKSSFDLNEVETFLKEQQKQLIALGGIDEDKINTVKKAGFSGIAVLGAIWLSSNPIQKFIKIKNRWEE